MHAFLTGSRAYGTPRDDSDVDLVVFMPSYEQLRQICGNECRVSSEGNYPDGIAFRFGRLNLIVFSSLPHYLAWNEATAELTAQKPVTRNEAIKAIDEQILVERELGSGEWQIAADLLRTHGFDRQANYLQAEHRMAEVADASAAK